MKKSIEPCGDNIKLIGDYFSREVEVADTPFGIFLDNQPLPGCLVRRWTLGEIVTAFAQNGFRLDKLIEEPSPETAQLLETFTLVATVD